MPTRIAEATQPSLSPMDEQLILLETLKGLLDAAVRSLSGGEALPLLELSRQITGAANDLMCLSLQVGHLPWTPEHQEQRRRLLVELSQQRAFCRAMLRRWRRSLALRQQLLGLRAAQDVPYTESLGGKLELR